jgi:hypothetical protein
MSRLNGDMPETRKPPIMLFGVAAMGNVQCGGDNSRNVINVIVRPGLLVIHESHTLLIYFLNGPYTLLSKGWSLWLQCGGNDSTVTPLLLQ